MGSKASTVPIYAAENCPAAVRGGLVMSWQVREILPKFDDRSLENFLISDRCGRHLEFFLDFVLTWPSMILGPSHGVFN